MRAHSFRLPQIALLSVALIAFSTGPVLAESACKGLEQGTCEGNGDCTWVNGYTRKDGKQVSGHCKSIGKRTSSSGTMEKSSTENPPNAVTQATAQ
jgi:hypothetical protein